jgi:hypothetical protein
MLTCDKCKKQITASVANRITVAGHDSDLCTSCYIDYREILSYAEIRTQNAVKRWLGLPIHCCEYCGKEGIVGKNLMEQAVSGALFSAESVISCTDIAECEGRIRNYGKQA